MALVGSSVDEKKVKEEKIAAVKNHEHRVITESEYKNGRIDRLKVPPCSVGWSIPSVNVAGFRQFFPPYARMQFKYVKRTKWVDQKNYKSKTAYAARFCMPNEKKWTWQKINWRQIAQ